MINGWRKVRLGEIAELANKTVFPSGLRNVPYVGLEHIAEGSNMLNGHGTSEEVSSAKLSFACGDILFGKLRPYLRKVVEAPFDGICSTDIWVVRSKNGADQRFLFYCLSSQPLIDLATAASEGTRMPRAKWRHISQHELLVPNIPEQRKIVEILRTWDEAIEETEALLDLWKRQKQGLMQALLTGERKLAGFEDQPWQEVLLGDISQVTMGTSPRSKAYNSEKTGLPLIQGNADIAKGRSAPKFHTSEITQTCVSGDILLSVRAPVGTIAVSEHDACIGRGIAAITPNKSADWNWLYQSLLFHESKWVRVSQGSTFDAICGSDVKKFLLSKPSLSEQRMIGNILRTWDDAIEKIEALLVLKAAQKKGLMQKLLTGKVRVS